MKEKVLENEKAASILFSTLLNVEDPETGQGLSMQELMAEAQFLLVAGSSWILLFRRYVLTPH